MCCEACVRYFVMYWMDITKTGSNYGRCCLQDMWRNAAEISHLHDSGYPKATNNILCATTSSDDQTCDEVTSECVEYNFFGLCTNDGGVCDCKFYFDCEDLITPTLLLGDNVPNQCDCYAGAFDCPEHEHCKTGVGFSRSPFCARTFPKIFVPRGGDVPTSGPGQEFCHTVSRFVGNNNERQMYIQRACDGQCEHVEFDAYCIDEPIDNVVDSINLWFESFIISSQIPGGNYVDRALSQEARLATVDEDCSDYMAS
eukprot:TRINITY_DN1263_c0_g1_i2.p1 TRINITY_DN1263_c0_g1~~TRINITY_DN1263_c0_g1_i2.p1  ORF type:complete len:256 (-),score=38.51 TRINITY_DN1263_c0_g1_i2:508-1275(-)